MGKKKVSVRNVRTSTHTQGTRCVASVTIASALELTTGLERVILTFPI
jgi:hypothetical protein